MMKLPELFGRVAAFLAIGATGWAQPAAPASSAPAAEREVIELSPFVINAEEDSNGYLASSTLAGSRLKTDLRDVAAAVTVLTNEFLDDLGATDIASALAFVAGGENDETSDPTGVNSLNQGFVGGDFGDVNTRAGEVRVRGLGRASTAANYIQVYSSPDRYNIDRTEFLRGANSILFGLAEPAGLINYSTKVANLRRSLNRVESKVDNFGSTRTVLDFSRPLIKDRLAVRAVGLYSDSRYKVKTAFQRDERLFATATFKPFASTTVRAFYEKTDQMGRRPNYRTVQDNVSGWLALHNQYAPLLSATDLARAFYWDPTSFPNSNGIMPNSVVTVNGQAVDLGLLRRTMDGKNNATALFYDNRDWATPQFGGAILTGSITSTGAAPTPANTRRFFARSASPLENISGYTDPQVTNPAIFPFEEQELSALPGNYRWERGDKLNFSLDHRVADNLYVSAAYQRETVRREQLFSPIAQQQQVSIDINLKLPNGQDNPNFLRPFVYGRSIGSYEDIVADNVIVQANYDHDFTKRTDRLAWLGFHRLTALYSRTDVDTLSYRWNVQVVNDIPGVMDSAQNNAARHLYQYWYIGDPVRVGDTSLRLTGLPSSTVTHQGRSYGYQYYNPVSRTWLPSPTSLQADRSLIQNGRAFTEQKNDGVGVSLQSFFWKRRIVTLAGWRRDSVDSFTNSLPTNNPPYLGATRADYNRSATPEYRNEADTMTQSVVLHVTPWLRVFGNRSENFAATVPRTDNLWRPIQPQSGETTEFGAGFTVLDGKLNVRVARYESSQLYATSGAAASTANLRVETIEDLMYDALVAAGRTAEWTTIGPNGSTNLPYDKPLNISASEDSVSKGWEAEVVYNPTRNWRLAFNLSKVDNRSTSIGRELGDFLAARAPFYRKLFAEGLRIDGTNNSNASTAALLSERFRDTVALNYVGNIVSEGTSNPGVSDIVAGLVTNYSFREGLLKGVSVGGNVRWEKGKIHGYRQLATNFNVGGLDNVPGVISDVSQPYISDAIISGGLMVGYRRKVWNDRIAWRVQLNAQNLFSEQGLRQIRVNPDNSPIWGVAPPLTIQLTNTFEF